MSGHSENGINYDKCSIIAFSELRKKSVSGNVTEVCGKSTTLFHDYYYKNQLTGQFSWWGKIFFNKEHRFREHISPSLHCIICHEAIVIGNEGIASLEDGRIVDIHLNFLHIRNPESLFRRSDNDLWVEPGVAEYQEGTFLFGMTPAWDNYAHWITDTLPLWYFYSQNLQKDGVKLVVGRLHKFQEDALKTLRIPEASLFRMHRTRVRFAVLLLVEPISLWNPPALVSFAGSAIGSNVASQSTPKQRNRRVFLSRAETTKRRLLNEREIMDALIPYGVESFLCSELSFEQQVSLMQSSELVIAPHGAALANIAFCRHGTHVLELFPEYCVQPHFRALAALGNMPYGYAVGTSFELENSRHTQNAWDAPFVVSSTDVKNALFRAIDSIAKVLAK